MKTIGISANILTDQAGMFPGYKRCYVNQDYIRSIVKQGAVPMVIPITDNDDIIEAQIRQVDALLLSGGQDVSPQLYNEDPQDKLGETLLARDVFDFKLIEKAKERFIPILGICRGAQVLNVFHGGSLFQDTSYRQIQSLRHWQPTNPTEKTHEIRVFPNTRLSALFPEGRFYVNSFHHQVVNQLAEGFRVMAQSNDGVIEAFESESYPYMVGIQWHPEMLWYENSMDALFKDFVDQIERR
ncbi:gamma-glutamyl-gamma-aminobutyrate hydrolase [Staphylococcus simulans]|uniref:gamma-glutamyl-gamma-aminobutyrate hydrolase family protein n=1 Tax=Staphylococcus simulans TaxID=1286 RepID=UPI000D09EDB5|nr:gamma-glutamyl-gamma-aminobutyrate hydrolase family protein [Staphylococcus simulans]AVO00932.1 gamma-glutamyl-gamma-aminobutyrate hydrolase [Staphylococcus simulans]AVO03883.1 gamma-glutamyl-gamma-aminobutyrate hydrolase [Staphylococcus simulans]AWG17479.1 gamma-glutamyl-gamma-aminobutyrate hydrolase [Staphylococcus simulans]AWI00447.1 gamma-glutamyl-gamma-aminobutyrate hydrolase [Staphylococcus simulans]